MKISHTEDKFTIPTPVDGRYQEKYRRGMNCTSEQRESAKTEILGRSVLMQPWMYKHVVLR